MCSHEIKRRLHLERKTMTKLDSISKSRNNTLPTKVHVVKAMVFPVVIYKCESWTIKKMERQKIDAFKLWCWRKLFRVPWTARKSNQPILKEINPEYLLEEYLLFIRGIFIRGIFRNITDAEAPILWPPDVKSQFIGKDSDAGKD